MSSPGNHPLTAYKCIQSHAHQQRPSFVSAYRAPSSYQKLPFYHVNNQQSPREDKKNPPAFSFFNSLCSPTAQPKYQNTLWNRSGDIQRNLFPSSTNIGNNPSKIKEESESDAISSNSPKMVKPKIVFSYNREKTKQANKTLAIPNSCDTLKKVQQGQIMLVEQFTLSTILLVKKEKNLKLCSNLFNHIIKPQVIKAIQRNYSNPKKKRYETTHQAKCNFKRSETGYTVPHEQGQKIKESKIASTQATRSFQAEGVSTSEVISQNFCKETTFDFSSIRPLQNKPNLNKQISPSNDLKKTMETSKYDFGGLVGNGIVTCPRREYEKINEDYEGNRKWRSYVKCLFGEDDNLKQSIHCGPQIRAQGNKCEILTGFGRQIAESCIPEHHFQ